MKINYHHINNFFVIPIPELIHYKTLGINHREKCNKILESYYNIDLNKLMEVKNND